jgi:hypothetical protein
VKPKRIIKSKDVVFVEGSKEIGGVPHREKEENVVVHEEVEGEEEPLTFSCKECMPTFFIILGKRTLEYVEMVNIYCGNERLDN